MLKLRAKYPITNFASAASRAAGCSRAFHRLASSEMSYQRASNYSKIELIRLSPRLVAAADIRSNALDSFARVCAGEIDAG